MSAGLSAKARGKRRALPEQALCIKIRFTWPGSADLSLVLTDANLSVREFKRTCILSERPELADKKLRIIYLGRLISDGILLLPYLEGILARQQVRGAAAGDRSSSSGAPGSGPRTDSRASSVDQSEPGRSPESPIWLNCSVAEVTHTPEDLAPDANAAELGLNAAPARGFDRLQEAGFSADEIETLRRQFQASRADGHLEDGPVVDDDDEHARAMEEVWMESNGNQEPAESSGEYTILLKGLCLGFLFPLLPLLWFKGKLFSKRMQMGIVAGLCINLIFGVLRLIA